MLRRHFILYILILVLASACSTSKCFRVIQLGPIKSCNMKRKKTQYARNKRKCPSSTTLYMTSSSDSSDSSYEDLLNQRIQEVRMKVLKEQLGQPPNANLSSTDFIVSILKALRNMDDPLPDFGCMVLLRSSTPTWKREILKSIGAPTWAGEAQVAAALGNALTRPKNQFGILVGGAEGEEGEEYAIQFPSDAVEDLEDERCWVECRLRDPETGTLLTVTGWDLKRRKDGAWLIDRLDWQDFRDDYRPGIGREEWIRVFG